jgi:hypothetical protein
MIKLIIDTDPGVGTISKHTLPGIFVCVQEPSKQPIAVVVFAVHHCALFSANMARSSSSSDRRVVDDL